ncbi:MAG: hypothetical protein II567_01890 [Candidatus Riflebacteria bacterium]|nr:hypothetical protein [Candidatus Riflebacteria bacterium]
MTEKNDNQKRPRNFFNKENSLAEFVIPFISSFMPVSAFQELYLRYEQYNRNYSEETIRSNSSIILFPSKEQEMKTNDYIKENQILLKKMIEIAFENNEASKEKYEEIEKQINNILNEKVTWRRKGNIGKKTDLKLETKDIEGKEFTLLTVESAKVLFKVIVKALVSAFDSYNSKKPIGYDYMGKCQCCGKLFVKSRKDNIYCSSKCNNKVKQDNFRANHMSRDK